MNKRPGCCPNPACENCHAPGANFTRKRGYYTPKSLGHRLARYQCKACGRTFSNRTESDDARQHRPDINKLLPRLLCSGVTMRRAAWILACSYNTVRARSAWLAERARLAHGEALAAGEHDTSYIQFDEMQTFEHAAAKALTIAIAIRWKTGKLLAARVGRIPANGHLAELGKTKYGWTINESAAACKAALTLAGQAAKPEVTVACDRATTYPGLMAIAFPAGVSVVPYKSRSFGGGADFDPLFKLNHACAKIRADLACMARKTWATTKKREKLQDRLDIYVAINNGYSFI
jgi:transposase-like protein